MAARWKDRRQQQGGRGGKEEEQGGEGGRKQQKQTQGLGVGRTPPSSSWRPLPGPPGPCCASARFSIRRFLACIHSKRLAHSLRWMLRNWCSWSFCKGRAEGSREGGSRGGHSGSEEGPGHEEPLTSLSHDLPVGSDPLVQLIRTTEPRARVSLPYNLNLSKQGQSLADEAEEAPKAPGSRHPATSAP